MVDIEAILAGVRRALGFDERNLIGAEIVAHGTGTLSGLPAGLTWHCHADGRARMEVASPLPEASVFNEVRGAHRGPAGLLESLDLADLDEFRLTSALFSGAWLDPRNPFVVEAGPVTPDTISLVVRVGPEPWRQRFRIILAAASLLPRRLETLAGDSARFDVDAFEPGVFSAVPRRLTWRRGWLTDTVEIVRVESAASASPYALVDAQGDRAARFDESAAPRVRASRSPRGRLPIVRASIDGQFDGWFVLDTGAGASGIEVTVADALRLPAVGRTWVMTPTGGMGASYRRGTNLRVGPVTLPDVLLIELDLSRLGRALGIRLAGILGFDLFARAIVRIGPSPLVIEIRAPDQAPDAAWRAVRFQHRVAVLEAVIGARGGRASAGFVAVDTASSAPFAVNAATARELGLTPSASTRAALGVSGTGHLGTHTLRWIDVGGERFEKVRAVVADTTEGMLASPTLLGSLGWGLLGKRNLLLDWARHRLAIMPAATAAPP